MIDFTDKNKQVELNQERLKEEQTRYLEIRSRIGVLSIFYSIFAAYSVQLIKFALTNEIANFLFIFILIIFLLLFLLSVVFAIRLIKPKEIAFEETPRKFYHDVYNDYKNNPNIPIEHIKYYIRETYLEQIEKAVEWNYRLNNKKSKFHYYAFTLAILAIIPYLICVGIKLTNDPEEIQKIELINQFLKIKNDTISNLKSKEIIMPENEENNQQGQQSGSIQEQEPTIDPNIVIHREPEMIKEYKEYPDSSKKPLHDNNDNE